MRSGPWKATREGRGFRPRWIPPPALPLCRPPLSGRRGRPSATRDDIDAAAADALLTPVLERLPEGLDTVLDEDGSSLSGGQARRVMLARAAVRDASILVLDEPLTGLDPEARDTVARAIKNIARGRTTLVIHHGDLDELQPDACLQLTHRPPPRRRLEAIGP